MKSTIITPYRWKSVRKFYTYQKGVVLHLLGCCSITHWLPLGGAAAT